MLPDTCGENTLHLDRCRFACKPGFYPSCDFPTIRCYIGQWIIGQSTCEPAANLVVQGAFLGICVIMLFTERDGNARGCSTAW